MPASQSTPLPLKRAGGKDFRWHGYIISDVERLRAPMQKITDHLLKCMGVLPSAEIIELLPNPAAPINLTAYGAAV